MSIEQRAKEREARVLETMLRLGFTAEQQEYGLLFYNQGYTDGKADQWEQSRFKEEGE